VTDGSAKQRCSTRCRRDKSQQHFHGGRLARAVRTKKDKHLTLRNLQGESFHGNVIAEYFSECFSFDCSNRHTNLRKRVCHIQSLLGIRSQSTDGIEDFFFCPEQYELRTSNRALNQCAGHTIHFNLFIDRSILRDGDKERGCPIDCACERLRLFRAHTCELQPDLSQRF